MSDSWFVKYTIKDTTKVNNVVCQSLIAFHVMQVATMLSAWINIQQKINILQIIFCNRTHQGGVKSRGIKKPLVNPATELITGDKRNAKLGNAQRTNISSAIHVWLRAMLTTNTCR